MQCVHMKMQFLEWTVIIFITALTGISTIYIQRIFL
jgi:hypothetical protein